MKVNGLPFLLTVSSELKFVTVEFLENMEMDNVHKCCKTAVELCNSRGFQIEHLLGDQQFDPMKPRLKEGFDITFNGAVAKEHIPKVERIIWVVKEHIKASISRFPWKEATPKLMVKEVVKCCTMMMNGFPPKSGIETCLSP